MAGARSGCGCRGADGGRTEPVPAPGRTFRRSRAQSSPARRGRSDPRERRRRLCTNDRAPLARLIRTMLGPYLAIVPMGCVTAAAIFVILAEAFQEPGDRMPVAPLGVIGMSFA